MIAKEKCCVRWPRGQFWKDCNGQVLGCWDHMALFSILSNQYGGDGYEKFALPNLAPLADKDGLGSSRYIICVSGEYPSRT